MVPTSLAARSRPRATGVLDRPALDHDEWPSRTKGAGGRAPTMDAITPSL
jgi:hypothetical protein